MSRLRFRGREGIPPVMFILIIVAGAVLLFEFVVPRVIESQLEDSIKSGSGVDMVESVRVRIRTFPAISLVSSGRVDSISIDCRGIIVEGFRIESLIADAKDIVIRTQALTGERNLVLSHIGQGQAEVVLTEDDLNRYVSGLEDVPKSVSVELRQGTVAVTGHVNVAGIDIPVNVDGKFVAEEGGTHLSYAINHIRVGNATLPSIISEGLLRGLDFSLDMSGLPIPVVISDIIMEDKIVRIIGRTLSDA